jgi:serine protease Do
VRGGRRQTLTVTVAALESDPDRQGAESGGERRFGVALGELTPEIRSRLNLPDRRGGALVANVARGGAAARAGIRPGDVILEVNRTPVKNAGEAAAALRAIVEKEVALVLLWREGQELFITIPGEQ